LHFSDSTVIVTRRISTESTDNEYFINNEPCRLKDIQEIFLDSGLSKESLGIISQGTVQ
jgi:chromosome segregation protein